MKKLLLSLLVWLFTLIWFSYWNICSPIEAKNALFSSDIIWTIDWDSPEWSTRYCVISNDWDINITLLWQSFTLHKNEWYCIDKSDVPDWIPSFSIGCSSSNCNLWWILFWGDCKLMSSLECQTDYNLIPIESVDINYCVSNQLCPACDLTWWNSELFINDIQHISAPLININIPEEFDWDYTWNDEEFLLDVKWYNVDTEYISSIITTQNSKPNNVDFNNIVSWLIPLLVPWLVLIAFIYFVFRFVKKIF